jgi:hypothetical protein
VALAQGKFPPDSLRNTKVIPPGTPVPQVVAMMRGFTTALGVRCTYCHVGREDQPLSAYDFVSDDKRAKQVARTMLQMMNSINAEHLARVPERPVPELRVTCETCHRGVARPVPIDQVLDAAAQAGGVDSALRAYRGLLARYRDRGSYDFSDLPLGSLAQRWAGQSRLDDALRLTLLNEEVHPASAPATMLRGELLLMKRDTAGAVDAYRAALQKDPASPARNRLTQLGKPPA